MEQPLRRRGEVNETLEIKQNRSQEIKEKKGILKRLRKICHRESKIEEVFPCAFNFPVKEKSSHWLAGGRIGRGG